MTQNKEIKSCPRCQEEIAANAKKCPKCQSDLRNWFMRHKILTGIIVLILFGVVISSGNTGKPDNNSGTGGSANTSKESQDVQQNYAIDDAIITQNMEVTVTSADTRTEVGGNFLSETASEGGVLVAVHWKYKNISDRPIGTFSQPSIKLVGPNGVTYNADLGKSSSYATEINLDRKILSDLNPGITVTDAEVFEVSEEAFAQRGWSVVVRIDGEEYRVAVN